MTTDIPLPQGTPRARVRRLANRGLLGRKAVYEVEIWYAGDDASTSSTRSITSTPYSLLKPLIGWDEAALVERRAREAWDGGAGPWVEAYTGRVTDT